MSCKDCNFYFKGCEKTYFCQRCKLNDAWNQLVNSVIQALKINKLMEHIYKK